MSHWSPCKRREFIRRLRDWDLMAPFLARDISS